MATPGTTSTETTSAEDAAGTTSTDQSAPDAGSSPISVAHTDTAPTSGAEAESHAGSGAFERTAAESTETPTPANVPTARSDG